MYASPIRINTQLWCIYSLSKKRAFLSNRFSAASDSRCFNFLSVLVQEARLEPGRPEEGEERRRRRRRGRGRGGGGGRRGGGRRRRRVSGFPSSGKTAPAFLTTTWVSYLATAQWIIMKHSVSLTTWFLKIVFVNYCNLCFLNKYHGNTMAHSWLGPSEPEWLTTGVWVTTLNPRRKQKQKYKWKTRSWFQATDSKLYKVFFWSM